MTPEPTTVEVVRRLQRHRAWSNAGLLDAARGLTAEQARREFPIGQGSVWRSLVHLLGADRLWLDAFEGRPDSAPPTPDDFVDLDGLAAAWAEVERGLAALLDRSTDADLLASVHRRDLAGNLVILPALDAHLQLCTHAAYTGAQVVNMLRQLGASTLPNLMYVVMRHAEGAVAVEPASGR